MKFIKKIFQSKNDSQVHSKKEIQKIAERIKKNLPKRMEELNSMQDYSVSICPISIIDISYAEVDPEFIELQANQFMRFMKEISLKGIVDVQDETVPYTHISNLDFYYESWLIMSFTTLGNKVSVEQHMHGLTYVFGKGMEERHQNLDWFSADESLLLVDLVNNIEINPYVSLACCKSNKEKNPFSQIENLYIKEAAKGHSKRMRII